MQSICAVVIAAVFYFVLSLKKFKEKELSMMKLVPRQEFMISLLTELFEPGESLEFPFYGAVLKIGKQNHVFYAYFGLTHNTMRYPLLNIS